MISEKSEKYEHFKNFFCNRCNSRKNRKSKNISFPYYMQIRKKQKIYCFLQVFFLCFYRLVPGKPSIYGGMFTFTAKPPEPEIRVCVHFHSHHIHFFITPINPQLLGLTEKVPLTVQTLNYW